MGAALPRPWVNYRMATKGNREKTMDRKGGSDRTETGNMKEGRKSSGSR